MLRKFQPKKAWAQFLASVPVKRVLHFWQRIRNNREIASVTSFGWTLVVATVIFALIGWNAGWLEFRSLAAMAITVIALAILFTLRRADLRVELHLTKPRVKAGQEALGRVLIRAATDKGSSGARIELPVGKAVASFRVQALGAEDEHEELFAIPTRRRAVIPIGPISSVQADPLGIISRKREHAELTELFVHPRIVALEAGAIGVLKDVEGVTTANLSSSDVSFHALREYVPGDDRRSVHWRTTARTGRLMVRQFEETMRAHLLLMLSTRVEDYATEDDFELAVSTVASLAVAALREDRQVSLHTSTDQIKFPSSIGLLDELCRVELGTSGADFQTLAIRAGEEPGLSVAGFVTGSANPADLRAAQLALPPSLFAFAIRCQEAQGAGRHQDGDLTVLDVASLDDLLPAVRSLS